MEVNLKHLKLRLSHQDQSLTLLVPSVSTPVWQGPVRVRVVLSRSILLVLAVMDLQYLMMGLSGERQGEDSLLDLLSSSGNESPNKSFIYDAEPQHVPGGEDSRLYAGSTVSTFQALILIMQFALRYILAELHRTFTAIMLNLQNNCYVS